MNTFWSESWKKVDPKRISEYSNAIDNSPDEVIALLWQHHAKTVCDAGCGCGIYCARLINHGFSVSGFDISEDAIQIARAYAPQARLKTADICKTNYPNDEFDAALSRDVLDHLPKKDARIAISELLRIVKPGGLVIFTLDFPDEEYLQESHEQNGDGDLIYTCEKWSGMVFHPYIKEEIKEILPPAVACSISQNQEHFMVILQKAADGCGMD